ncbi:hypothetical protein [Ascidiimonas aurantiaca]|uniref:hypothetical protein n=1 Tax=Ascidiimonas aurantiaca TaxID=1685432 RepID=UPI0030EB3F02
MNTFITFLGVLFFFLNEIITIETRVYICNGKGSKRYHYTKSCRGLARCSTAIDQVTLSKAKEMRRTLCGWED